MMIAYVAGLAMLIAAQLPIVSPDVHPDRTVTFRFQGTNAQKVSLGLEGTDDIPMTKDSHGVWSCTTPPLAPDIYGYAFNVDGESTLDPHNPAIKPNMIWVGNMVTVPGQPPEAWEVQAVPHGTLHRHFYKSSIIGDERDMVIYTPPGYESSNAKYPVLYLLHGYSDTANGWTAVGQAHVILDNLIAQGKAKPMIIVMTLGYGVPDFAKPGAVGFSSNENIKKNYDRYRDSLFGEVMPQVASNYRVDGRKAIAGLSMGGAESLYIGLNATDQFEALGSFSAGGLFAGPEEMFPKFSADKANALKPFYLACGTEDGLISPNRETVKWLKGKGVNVQAVETPGRHAWMVWRRNLIAFCGQLFRD